MVALIPFAKKMHFKNFKIFEYIFWEVIEPGKHSPYECINKRTLKKFLFPYHVITQEDNTHKPESGHSSDPGAMH